MNRHLNNSLTALVASATLLVAGLMAATPNAPQGSMEGAVAVANAADGGDLDASNPVQTAVLATALEQAALTFTNESPRATRTSPRKRRQVIVMPYLSFAPRG